MEAVKRAIQALISLSFANSENKIDFTGSINRAVRAMRFTMHTRLKMSPFKLHHDEKPRIELTNIVKDNKSYWSDSPTGEH